MHEHSDSEASSTPLERAAAYLQQRGLAAPALLLLHLARPLGFLGSQLLLFIQPFGLHPTWDHHIEQTAAMLEDDATWERLDDLLK